MRVEILISVVSLDYLCLTCIVGKGERPEIDESIHGSDGMGNIFLPPPKGQKIEMSASEFLVEKVSEYPGEVSILALGPLTNLALVSCTVLSCYSRFIVCIIVNWLGFWVGDQKGCFFCKQSEENSHTWWFFLCPRECDSCC